MTEQAYEPFLCSLGGNCNHPICGFCQPAIKRSRRNTLNAHKGAEKRKMNRPRAGEGIEAYQNDDGTYDTRRNGRAWRYDQDWDEVLAAARQQSVTQVQHIDTSGYRATVRV